MRKTTIVIVSFLATACAVFAGKDTYQELCNSLEAAVKESAHGDFRAALRDMDSLSQTPSGPKETLINAEKNKPMFDKFAELGPLDEVEQISLVFTGKSFLRVKYAEKREKGAILWTFIGYKYKDQWYCKNMNVYGGSDLADLMGKGIDPADAQSAPKD